MSINQPYKLQFLLDLPLALLKPGPEVVDEMLF